MSAAGNLALAAPLPPCQPAALGSSIGRRALMPVFRPITHWRHKRWSGLAARVAAAAQQPDAAAGAASAAALPILAAGGAVANFLDAFDARSLDGMLACLSSDVVYHNLNVSAEPAQGLQAVSAVMASLVSGAPPGWRLVIDDATADSGAAVLSFHLADASGAPIPLSRGIAFYRLDQAGSICWITEAWEQAVKVPQAALPALGAAAPLLQALGSSPWGGLALGVQPAVGSSPLAGPVLHAAAGPRQGSGGSSSGGRARRGSGGRSSGGLAGGQAGSVGMSGQASMPAVAAAASGMGGSTAGSSGSSGGGGDGLDALVGVWLKDQAASDMATYSRACDLMQLSGLQKTTAMQLIEGLEIERRGSEVAVRFLTVVPFFKVTEQLALGGVTSMARRDLRPGTQQAAAAAGPSGDVLEVQITWGEPNAGSVNEQYRLIDGRTLECVSTVSVAAGTATTRTVYRRSDGWQPRFLWNPLFGRQ